ncbi:MAG: GDSL-type esterase/lipase family protein [Bacteroidetes bacterium]|nr:GDSL-type esterase/lipase family protein [Bacteroidota bacterium]
MLCLCYGTSLSQTKTSAGFIPGSAPVGFESEINAFLRNDSASFPPPGGYLFTGSSTIRKWENLAADFSEITVIRRGFGGSTQEALNYYINDIVLPYKPRTIVVYEGDNDLVSGITPGGFVALCDTFIQRVHGRLPGTMIYFVSVKPSFTRKQYLPVQHETNRLLKKLARNRRKTKFIDITPLMYDTKGNLRKDLFEADSLHINNECYAIWAIRMKRVMGIAK